MQDRLVGSQRTRCGFFLVVALLVANCSHHKDCGGDVVDADCSGTDLVTAGLPQAPDISGLKITALSPERVNTVVHYSAQVSVLDFQSDVGGGRCEIALSVGTTSVPIPSSVISPVTCLFTVTVPAPTQVTGAITVIDRNGHRSNSLAFVLGIT